MSILVPCVALLALSGFFFWMAHTTSRKYRKRRPTRHEALTGATMGSKETKDDIVVLLGERSQEPE